VRLFYFTRLDLSTCTDGSRSHVEGIARGLHAQGWDVTLFTADGGTGLKQPSFPFRHIVTGKRGHSLPGHMVGQLRLAWALFRLKGPKPDAVYVRMNYTLIAPIIYALCKRIPCFLEINTLLELETSHPRLVWAGSSIEKWILRRARGVFPVTEELKACYMRRVGLPAEKFEVMPNGCDAELCQHVAEDENDSDRGCATVGFLGVFNEWQGVETVLQAVPLIRQLASDVSFVIAGHGPQRAEYEKIVEELNISELVSFPGVIAKKDVQSFLRKCDAVVAPFCERYLRPPMTFIGRSPLKLYTYLACERVVVTSNLPGMGSFAECPAVRFARAGDPADFARAIVEVLRMSPEQRAALGRKGRQFVLDGHTWDQIAGKTADAISRWCSEPPV
jgi:glycosyltransferase involved in cell wall biosynthesis